jgi:hypothetical protein
MNVYKLLPKRRALRVVAVMMTCLSGLRFPVSGLEKVFNRQRPDLLPDCHEQRLAFLARQFLSRRLLAQEIH